MYLKLLLLCGLIGIVKPKININFDVDKDGDVSISYSGKEVQKATNYDYLEMFDITEADLKRAVEIYNEKSPDQVSINDPPPWGDKCNWGEKSISRVISIKSATVRGSTKRPVTVNSRDYENTSKIPIKVNGGITYTVENKLTTNWSRQVSSTSSSALAFDVKVNFFVSASLTGNSSSSYTSNWGISEEKSVKETIGTNSGFETELKPGQAVTALLSVNTEQLEIDVVYRATLEGNLRFYYKNLFKEYNCWRRPIDEMLTAGGLKTEATVTETVKYVFHTDMSLKVYDKATGLLL